MSNKPKTEADTLAELAKVQSAPASKRKGVRFSMFDEDSVALKTSSDEGGIEVLGKSVVNTLEGIRSGKKFARLAFEEDPSTFNKYRSLYKPKGPDQIPDFVLKRISMRADLVSAIVFARANHVSAHGHPLEDRFSVGFRIDPRKGIMDGLSAEQKKQVKAAIREATNEIATCGKTEGMGPTERMSLATFLYQQARNAVVFGRFATEIGFTGEGDEKKFHAFRPVDVGTIYDAQPHANGLDQTRKQALKYLEGAKNEKLNPEKFRTDDYAYVQVINGQPRQAFTDEELIVHNVYPVTDVELLGYPVTPIDMAVDAILTYMNITTHNKLYFQSGRAARGMIVIKSADINQDIVAQIREHFNASINSVGNSHRIPVFGIDPTEEISWEPLEVQGGRDQEFQYLADSNCRVILSAFQMGPEELPGYGHLSKGTNSQALSESDNEYKLQAARDVGIRPLLKQFQDFLNERILPLINPTLAKLCTVKFIGLDQDTPEKENARIQAEMATHSTYNEVLVRVEKDPIPRQWGGDIPLNPGVTGNWDKYFTVAETLAYWCDRPEALKDPTLQYRRDPFFFNMLQLQMQKEQMAQQQEQMQAQQQAESQQQQGEQAKEDESNAPDEGGGELVSGIDQLEQLLGKSETALPASMRRLLSQHRMTVKNTMDEWEKESEEALQEVLKTAKSLKPKKG